jgi:hypothetical protein
MVLPDPPLRAAIMMRGGLKIIEIKPTSTQKIPLLSPFTKREEIICLHLPLFSKEGSGEILGL